MKFLDDWELIDCIAFGIFGALIVITIVGLIVL